MLARELPYWISCKGRGQENVHLEFIINSFFHPNILVSFFSALIKKQTDKQNRYFKASYTRSVLLLHKNHVPQIRIHLEGWGVYDSFIRVFSSKYYRSDLKTTSEKKFTILIFWKTAKRPTYFHNKRFSFPLFSSNYHIHARLN